MRLRDWVPAIVAIGPPFVVFSLALGIAAPAERHGEPPATAITPNSSAPPTPTPPPSEPAASPPPSASPPRPTPQPEEDLVGFAAALEVLQTVPMTVHEPGGYFRDAFGQGWGDPDRNGCDTRNDILGRDLVDQIYKPGTGDCVVLSGVLHDVYTGLEISFVRGPVTSEAVQIDHIVPLAWAWRNGAAGWDDRTRELFANDPLNLLAVDGPTNMEKSDLGPADWLPANVGYRCEYALNWVEILDEYPLTVSAADRNRLVSVLVTC